MASKGIYVSLPPDVVERIDEICGGPHTATGKARSGITGGRAAWVRRLIYQELQLAEPVDVHRQRSRQFQEQITQHLQADNGAEWDTWVQTVNRLRELRGQGLSLRQIAAVLQKEERPTRRGGKWSAQTVRNVLKRTGG